MKYDTENIMISIFYFYKVQTYDHKPAALQRVFVVCPTLLNVWTK
jgi:hypothetical protein